MVYTMQPTGVSRPIISQQQNIPNKMPIEYLHRISPTGTSPLTNKPSLEAFRTRTEFWGYQPIGSRIRISVTTSPNRFPCSNHWTIGIASNPENLWQDPWRTWNHPWNPPKSPWSTLRIIPLSGWMCLVTPISTSVPFLRGLSHESKSVN